jgi:hypothetical protein
VDQGAAACESCDSGAACGCYGYPSDNLDAAGCCRLYTNAECDAMGGNWPGNGECLKVGGGSWSYSCRQLNAEPTCGASGAW